MIQIAFVITLLLTGLAPLSATATETPAAIETARIKTPRPESGLRAEKPSGASEVVRGFYDQLLFVMQQGNELGFSGRYDRLKPAIERAFDLETMTRFASGTGWLKADAAQKRNLVGAFSDFSVATYAKQFKSFDGESFAVKGETPATGGGVIVMTQLTPGGDEAPVSLNYLLRRDAAGSWKINDVFLDATISQLATRRAEFTAVIKQSGVDGLISTIRDKAKQLRS